MAQERIQTEGESDTVKFEVKQIQEVPKKSCDRPETLVNIRNNLGIPGHKMTDYRNETMEIEYVEIVHSKRE